MKLNYRLIVNERGDGITLDCADDETTELDEFRKKQLHHVFESVMNKFYNQPMRPHTPREMCAAMRTAASKLLRTQENWYGFEVEVNAFKKARSAIIESVYLVPLD